jgi:hypothetical protein
MVTATEKVIQEKKENNFTGELMTYQDFGIGIFHL